MARPDPTARTDRVSELMDSLVTGVETLTSSEDWRRWLDVARRFHRYRTGGGGISEVRECAVVWQLRRLSRRRMLERTR